MVSSAKSYGTDYRLSAKLYVNKMIAFDFGTNQIAMGVINDSHDHFIEEDRFPVVTPLHRVHRYPEHIEWRFSWHYRSSLLNSG